MADSKISSQLVYGLDIGTRSIVGTVGYRKGKKFIVVALESIEHETRSMVDGQIHDIGAVARTIRVVTDKLENKIGSKLNSVCIAAAGRVLKTVRVHTDIELDEEKTVTEEDIYTLNSTAIEEAYKLFLSEQKSDIKFYCVGSSVVKYYLNNNGISNLLDHKAQKIGVDLIGTFLPDEVVDGLYKAVDQAGLEVASLTLEPIAAIGLAIPEKFRLLNIALVDVGAGTTDISITKDGSVVAFGMIPTAGDLLTEKIANHCMVDFNTADYIKKQCSVKEEVEYEDIFGLPLTVKASDIASVIEEDVKKMAGLAADKIKKLNGDKSVGAVFVVGGGGAVPGYTEMLAAKLKIPKERVALRGKEVMNDIVFEDNDIDISSLLVTPIGIALSFYEETNNFIYVDFNGSRVKIYNNNNLTVADVALQTDFPADGFFPKSGPAISYTLNGNEKLARGSLGEPAVIKVNGENANMHSAVKENDIIEVIPSTAGESAKITIASLPGFKETIKVNVNDMDVVLPKYASVNGKLESGYYEIQDKDDVEILDYYTVTQVKQFMDINVEPDSVCLVNNSKAGDDTKIYENFSVVWKLAADIHFDSEMYVGDYEDEDSLEEIADSATDINEVSKNAPDEITTDIIPEDTDATDDSTSNAVKEEIIHVTVNNESVILKGKSTYVFVDVFDSYSFDLSKPKGNIVTKINGKNAQYMEEIHNGDVMEIYWEEI